MPLRGFKIFGFVICIFLFAGTMKAQLNAFDRINYVLKISDNSGNQVAGVCDIRVSLLTNTELLFQENHSSSSFNKGLINILIGGGVNTSNGIYSSLRNIFPIRDSIRIKVELNINSAGYFTLEDRIIKSSLFSARSIYNIDTIKVIELTDVAFSSNSNNQILKYSNNKWLKQNDSLGYITTYAQLLGSSQNSDTANFSYVALPVNDDTAAYSFQSLNSQNTVYSQNVIYSDTSNFSQVALSADSVINAWHYTGDYGSASNKLGTTDSVALLFKTNSNEVIKIKPTGSVTLLSDTSSGDLNVKSINGFLFQNTSGNNYPWINSANGSVLLFCAQKGSFMGGNVNDNRWFDTTKMAANSFAFGNNVLSDGWKSSVVFGDSCYSTVIPPPTTYSTQPVFTSGHSSFTFGKNCVSNGAYAISMGYGTQAQMIRNVAMGYRCKTSKESANIAMGYLAEASGSTAASFGYKTLASGHKSTAFGNLASTKGFSGGFVYGDASTILTNDTIKNTGQNQFVVRAAGGVHFFSDTNATTGVLLAPGSGSWSMMSDTLSKANFSSFNPEYLMKEFGKLKLYKWNYIGGSMNVKHLGPLAQNFYSAFKLGESEKMISSVDADGVIFSSIINLNQRIENLQFKNKLNKLKAEVQSCNYFDLNNRADELLIKLTNQKK